MACTALQGKLRVWGLVVCVGAGKGTDLWCGGGSSEAAAAKGVDGWESGTVPCGALALAVEMRGVTEGNKCWCDGRSPS